MELRRRPFLCGRAGWWGPWAQGTDHGPFALSCSPAGARELDTEVFPIAAPLQPWGLLS